MGAGAVASGLPPHRSLRGRRAIAVRRPPAKTAPSSRRRNRRGEGERLRADILRATERLLLKTGDEAAVSIRAIADAVGVTPPSIYMHFPDKEALIVAVCAEHFAKLDEVSEAAVVGVEEPLARIEARGRAYIRFGLENPEPYRVMFMTRTAAGVKLTKDELADMAAFDHLEADVVAAVDAGQLVADADPFAVACGLWAMVHGITSLLIAKPEFPWPPLDDFIMGAITCSVVPPQP